MIRVLLVWMFLPLVLLVQVVWGLVNIPALIVLVVFTPKKEDWFWLYVWDHMLFPLNGWLYGLTGVSWEMMR